MEEQAIQDIVKRLHNPTGRLPRIEVGGVDKPPEALRIGSEGTYHPATLHIRAFGKFSEERRRQAVYVLNDYHDLSGGNSCYNIDYIQFQKSDLEKLVKLALESKSKEATISCSGKRTVFKEDQPYGSDNGWTGPRNVYDIKLRVFLKIVDRTTPTILFEFPKVWYPTSNGGSELIQNQ